MKCTRHIVSQLVILTVGFLAAYPLNARADQATFTGTGILPGGVFSYATNVSGDGSVVLGSSDNSNGQIGFKWTAAGGIQTVPFPPGNGAQGVNGVSRDGSIIIGAAFGDVAFQWTARTARYYWLRQVTALRPRPSHPMGRWWRATETPPHPIRRSFWCGIRQGCIRPAFLCGVEAIPMVFRMSATS